MFATLSPRIHLREGGGCAVGLPPSLPPSGFAAFAAFERCLEVDGGDNDGGGGDGGDDDD